MASQDQIRALVTARTNPERFHAIVLQIAAAAEAKSPQFASSLKWALDHPDTVHRSALTPLPQMPGGLLLEIGAQVRFADMVLDAQVHACLTRIIAEHDQRARLLAHGLHPARKLLLVGEPGVGKTMTAAALATHLDLHCRRVQLHEVIKSHLGETSAMMHKVFDEIRQTTAVYLFDEFDALGAVRSPDGDSASGEIRRVVNSLLQFIEDDQSASVIIACTNHRDLLDPALFRRFDEVIAYPLPTSDIATQMLRRTLIGGEDAELNWQLVCHHADGLSHSDLASVATRVNKHVIMHDLERPDDDLVLHAIYARQAGKRQTDNP